MIFKDDRPHDHCGVFGIFAPKEDGARLTFYGLLALQHRGQESAGIASSNFKKVSVYKSMGLVNQVFTERKIKKLQGSLAIGHTRYSTEGSSILKNAQPIVLSSLRGDFALVHNGNLANYKELKKFLFKKGHCFSTDVDSELIARLIVESKGRGFKEKIINGTLRLKGAFSLVLLTKEKLYVIRDQWGVRPLVLGKINSTGWLIASESVAIESIGGKVIREIQPGEFIEISKKGLKTFHRIKNKNGGFCIFEYVYFSRPDSVINGRLVHLARMKAGKILAAEHPAKADMVISVPDSGTSAALGFSQQSGIPFQEGLIKSRYIGRTFIQPGQRIRNLGVRLKFNPLTGILKNKNVVLVDDSIVRGTTIAQIIKMLKKAGIKKVHLRIASPPFKNICYLGIDVKRYDELIANKNIAEKIRKKLNVDSLGYLSLSGLKRAVGKINHRLCTGCFNGDYPVKNLNKVSLKKQMDKEDKIKKIAVLISNKGSGSNLQAIIDNGKLGNVKGEIVVVVSDKADAYGLTRAKKNKIPAIVKQFSKFKDKKARSIYGDKLARELKEKYQVDLVILAGWMIILPPSFLKYFPYQVINLHPGLIADKFDGKLTLSDGSMAKSFEGEMADDAIQTAIKSGVKISGSTTHFVTKEVDWGPVIMRAEEKIRENDSVDSFYTRLKKKEHLILPLSVKLFCEDKLKVKNNLVKILDKRFKKHRL